MTESIQPLHAVNGRKGQAQGDTGYNAQSEAQNEAMARWQTENNAHLMALSTWVLSRLESNETQLPIPQSPDIQPPTAFALISRQYRLSKGDQAVLALSIATAVDARVAQKCGELVGIAHGETPTMSLALACFPEVDWSVFSPHAPLRYWLLVEWQPAGNGDARLVIDERVLNYVRGLNYIDERLSVLLEPPKADFSSSLMPSQQKQLQTAINYLNQTHGSAVSIELYGDDAEAKTLMATAIAQRLNLDLQRINQASIPSHAADLDALARLWLRESSLTPLLLLIDASNDGARTPALKQFVSRIGGLTLVDAGHAPIGVSADSLPLLVSRPTVDEQRTLWQTHLSSDSLLSSRLAEQFALSEQEISQFTRIALSESSVNETDFSKAIWRICQRRASAELSKLASRIECKANWDTLVLPEAQTKLLKQLTAQVELRNRVYQQWGFRERMSRGLGISAMFAGESGTGKTMAAEVIANALNLDLYRIDLASVISKYIGETEKRLRELFQAAERCGAMLFFDEADALFGKRGEVRNSNDRFANIGIDDLLQRIEMYNGVAILATNLKSAVDKAFLRRLRFVIDFPFPGPAERERIWRTVFPEQTPLAEDMNPARLAKLNLTGGSIHNVALNAAFLSAQQGESVSMRAVMEAAAVEMQKLDRPIKSGDLDYV